MIRFSAIIRVNLASLMAQIVQVGGFPVLLAFALDRLSLNQAVIGAVATLPWLAVLAGAGFIPRLIHKTSERVVALGGVLLSLLGLCLLLLPATLPTLVFAALLMGGGLVLRWVACDTWIVALAPPKMRGRAIGFHETLMGLGIAIGPALLLLGDQGPLDPTWIFVGLFVISAILFAVSALGRENDAPPDGVAQGAGKTLYLLLAGSVFAAILSGFAETSAVALLPLWYVEMGVSETLALSLLVSFGLGGTLLQLPIGAIADRYSLKAAQGFCAAILVAGCAANLWVLATPLGALYALVFLWGGAIGGLNTLAVIEAGARTSGPETSRAMAMIASAYTVGGVIGPATLGGVWGVFGTATLMFTLGVIGVGYLLLIARRGADGKSV